MIWNFLSRRREDPAARAVYGAIVAQARQPHFYAELSVPDTVTGRFDMIALHATLLFCRLGRKDPDATEASPAADFAQKVFDLFFVDMDHNLRELGVNDVSVAKKVTKLAEVFYGVADAYSAALGDNDAQALREALLRNVYSSQEDCGDAAQALAAYMFAAHGSLSAQPEEAILSGAVEWPDPAPFVPQGA